MLVFPLIPRPHGREGKGKEEEEEEIKDPPNHSGDDKGFDESEVTEYSHHREELMSRSERSPGEFATLCS